MFKISVIKRFEYIAKKYPNNIAIITKEKKITYSVLNKDANKLAHYIKNNNILTKNKAIGIFIEPSIDMVISVLAIQKLGVPYVPIDVSYPYKENFIFLLYLQTHLKNSILLIINVYKKSE